MFLKVVSAYEMSLFQILHIEGLRLLSFDTSQITNKHAVSFNKGVNN